ncbi:hypothetical protein [Luteolibacter marinus]|uniref:hypothetical protein n=1 Tax=Luteolibacter marinus TaxID=2776705 RepID=UPI0018681121|nr:hypothetical protein [Luteolibacter marinus]
MSTAIAAFITGHSVRGCTGLSRDQRDFQSRSWLPSDMWLPHNFPYHPSFPFPGKFSLATASFNNIRHYLGSRRPAFRQRHREEVARRFSKHERVILLAGSCGLELLNNLDLPPGILGRIHVFAYGPVSRQLPATASHCLVQGRGDFISRFFHPRPDHRIVSSHMGYLRAPETLHLFDDYCRRILGQPPGSP